MKLITKWQCYQSCEFMKLGSKEIVSFIHGNVNQKDTNSVQVETHEQYKLMMMTTNIVDSCSK